MLCIPERSERLPFRAALESRWRETQAFLCVGLDPIPERLPEPFASARDSRAGSDDLERAVSEFCRNIIKLSSASVCAFKPQFAHFAALGLEDVLADLIRYIHHETPGVPVILDAKRGDIGATAERYAIEAFERYDADAVTLNPWLGPESIEPYLSYQDRGSIVLCRTSNQDSAWLQAFDNGSVGREPYLAVARKAQEWNSKGNVMLVAGATYTDELCAIRDAAGDDVGLLVPGIGAQGGDLEYAFRAGADSRGFGVVMNSSRAILYAGAGEDYEYAAANEVKSLTAQMRRLREGYNVSS